MTRLIIVDGASGDPLFSQVVFLLEPSLDTVGSTTPVERKNGLAVTASDVIVSSTAGPFGGPSIELVHTGAIGASAGVSYEFGSASWGATTPTCFEGWFYTRSFNFARSQMLMAADAAVDINYYQANFPLGVIISEGAGTGYTPPLNEWVHYAFLYDGAGVGISSLRTFVGGVLRYTQSSISRSAVTSGTAFRVGSLLAPANIGGYRPHDGLCGGVRFTVGSQRYSTAGFTPPTAPFPTN